MRLVPRISLVFMFCVSGSLCGVAADAENDAFFEKQIRPLLVKRCYKCHGGTKASGGLLLDRRSGWQKGGENGPAIIPGRPEESLLIQAVNYDGLQMPPPDAGGKLSDEEISALTKWVELGAPDPRRETARFGGMNETDARSWWAFQPLPSPTEPATAEQIDERLHAELARQSLTPNPATDRRTLIRRATYNLAGLPPSTADVKEFLDDTSDDAFQKVIDRLLQSPEYGVKWGRHWLDVVRYADTAGENTDRPLPHAWRYRNWVYESFNRDLPYDQFVQMQIAGDILNAEDNPEAFREGVIATGYLAIARRFGHDIDKDIHLMHEDVIDNVGKNFLGLSTGCARCHDHKYDPITADDYYALYGIFSSTKFSFPGCEPKGQPRDLVPLLPQQQIDDLTTAWRQRNAAAEAEKKQHDDSLTAIRCRLQQAVSQPPVILAAANVGEGASASFAEAKTQALDELSLHKGEILQLTVLPNASHGADSTLVEFQVSELGTENRQWQLADLISDLLQGNPHTAKAGATWCFLEVTGVPEFLSEKRDSIDGHDVLNAWRLDDTPSVFVNRSDQAVNVWTSLPAKSFFVHPGVNRPVAVAWTCPADMTVRLSGRVMDAHPSGGDGVAFRLEHHTSPDAAPALVELGTASNSQEILIEPAPIIPVAYAVTEGTVQDARLHERGDHEQLGDPVRRRWLSILGGQEVPEDAGSGRRQLAGWISQHPLAARVMVNRIWQWHFGRGVVATPNDFGSRGQSPDHPELLDWLAAQFQASGYSVKAMHRLIMSSAAWQRSSAATEPSASQDPENRLLARFARRRLDAEEIRDTLLAVAGSLDTVPGEAHPFPAEETWKFTQHDPFNAVYDTNKRSAFLMVQRQRQHPYLTLFDGPDPNASTPVRQKTTVPTQALYFLNAPFFHEQAANLSKRIFKIEPQQERIRFAFLTLYQREPHETEVQEMADLVARYPGTLEEKWNACCRVLMASNEFLYLD